SHPEAKEQVLSTLNKDGSRRWMRPQVSRGRFYRARLILGWLLIVLFVGIPFVTINGKPMILLNVAEREFTFFGTTFLPTDTLFLMLLMLGIFVSIFLITAVFGRAWCGWGCPQTVYMELLFRPLEKWIEGGRTQQLKLDRQGPNFRRVVKYFVFGLISVALANVFLAYFVGVDTLALWMLGSPLNHPTGFAIVAVTSAMVFIDFAYFREQMCTIACPYARLQSALLDKRSLIVGYDVARGEPRGKGKTPDDRKALGDCIDCKACVVTCPTGIDIRNGLQMECIACTQCIDACDDIMTKVGKPLGLIRYTSQANLESGTQNRLLRPRVIIYSVVLVGLVSALVLGLNRRESADVTILRNIGAPFSLTATGEIQNQVRIKITNRSAEPANYTLSVPQPQSVQFIAPINPLPVQPGETESTSVFVVAPKGLFNDGKLDVTLRVTDGAAFTSDNRYHLLGPR
ncbi:MAG: cytochrome c oxidase accessory protein CcoG, partial [Myxococcales bacterium]|nr:cytochrome c oxidase accessory protein CcoG [Myxococcales bacterium]